MSKSSGRAFWGEVRAILRLAWPIILAQLAGVGMGAVDTVFAGRVGPQALAGVAVGVNFAMLLFVPVMGLMMSVAALTANLRGAGYSYCEIGQFQQRARRLAVWVAALWFLSLNVLGPSAIAALGLADETTRLAQQFLHAWSFSALGFSAYFVQRFSAEGMGRTRVILIASLSGLAMNTLLDWVLVLPHAWPYWGRLTGLGGIGCGVATSLSSAFMALVLRGLFQRDRVLRAVMHADELPEDNSIDRPSDMSVRSLPSVRDILRLGGPIGAVMLAESALFVLTALLMARFGESVVASYQIAINVAALGFMIPVGVAQATTVRVGLAMGAKQFSEARFRGHVGMGVGLLNAASNGSVMWLAAGPIVSLYTADTEIARRAAHFLLLAAAFQFFDGLQVTANGALRGIKDAHVPMAITLVAYWLCGMPAALEFAYGLVWGPDGLWWGLTAGLGVAALGLTWRFEQQAFKLAHD